MYANAIYNERVTRVTLFFILLGILGWWRGLLIFFNVRQSMFDCFFKEKSASSMCTEIKLDQQIFFLSNHGKFILQSFDTLFPPSFECKHWQRFLSFQKEKTGPIGLEILQF
jgi:hypothetical protein